ncbi:MAG: hypothetical protein JXR37_16575 [Kiritimatiellae bacterium]|nr:hypothetical protein [Kiritimatiellia bacterium]
MEKKRIASETEIGQDALAPFKHAEWRRLTPGERLLRSWRLRARLPDPIAVHDRKLFPKP